MFPKSRTSVVAVVFATLGVMALAVWLASDPFEPRLNGRRDREVVLSIWESRMRPGKTNSLTFEALGPERSVAAIVKLLASYQQSLRTRQGGRLGIWWLDRAYGKWPSVDRWVSENLLSYREPDPNSVRQEAVRSLARFCPTAAPAVPLLVDRLIRAPHLDTVKTLGAIGPAAAPAVPHIRRLASSNDLWFLHSVGESLRRIEPGSELIILPTSLANLSSTNERVRAKAAQLLSLIGPPASNAIPRLRELRGDSWKMVRDAADQALASITPSSAPARP
jgi:hypothetical protein